MSNPQQGKDFEHEEKTENGQLESRSPRDAPVSAVCITAQDGDYRRYTGCAHARHEACPQCACSECGSRVVRAVVNGYQITIPAAALLVATDSPPLASAIAVESSRSSPDVDSALTQL